MIAFPGHSVFQTTSGKFYALQTEDDEASSQLARRVREADKTQPLCLELSFEGELLDDEDFTGRKIVDIKTLDHVRTVACPD